MLEKFASKLSSKVCGMLDLTAQQQEIIKYGLVVLISNLTGFFVVTILALLLDVLAPTMAIMVTLLLLRPAAGGAHCNTPLTCNLLGLAILPLLGLFSSYLADAGRPVHFAYVAAAVLFAGVFITKNAPYFTQNKPRASARERQLKRRALITVIVIALTACCLILIGLEYFAAGLSTGLFWQGVMLTKTGIQVITKLDNLLLSIINLLRR
jgi:accessory gene regulator protein AgrB